MEHAGLHLFHVNVGTLGWDALDALDAVTLHPSRAIRSTPGLREQKQQSSVAVACG